MEVIHLSRLEAGDGFLGALFDGEVGGMRFFATDRALS
jgi:hypothetical protein